LLGVGVGGGGMPWLGLMTGQRRWRRDQRTGRREKLGVCVEWALQGKWPAARFSRAQWTHEDLGQGGLWLECIRMSRSNLTAEMEGVILGQVFLTQANSRTSGECESSGVASERLRGCVTHV
jgi:hypothetical protein